MSFYWRNHPDLPDVDLPQAIMRPFWHPETLKLDDKQFCMLLELNRPVFTAGFILLVSFAVIAWASLQFYEIYLVYAQHQILNQKLYIELAIASAFLFAALLGFYLFYQVHSLVGLDF